MPRKKEERKELESTNQKQKDMGEWPGSSNNTTQGWSEKKKKCILGCRTDGWMD
jgi:hypothetical protein